MEAIEEFTGSNDHTVVVKGKRTKRSRPLSPFGMAVTSSSSSGGGGGGGGGGDVCYSAPSPTTSGEFSTTTEEEEDMANCLILLAQGVGPRQVEKKAKIEKFSSTDHHPRLAMATATTGSTGIYVYECKTCNRTFPSFQALGGHRASHKKPKAMAAEEKKVMSMTPFDHDDHHSNMIEDGHFINISPPVSLQIVNKPSQHQQHMNNNKAKVHECSVCGTEFSSGQALGGHMRRHRTHTNTRLDTNSTIQSQEDEKPIRHVLSLDLNLPAPEDDHRDSKFQFASNQQHLVFSSPALVDCHY